MLIAYEGIDGSGKTTSSASLSQALSKENVPNTVVRWTSFQTYQDESEEALFRIANKRRLGRALGPLSYALWHCADFAYRWETLVLPALSRGEIVIMDRYKYTALVRDVIRGLNERFVENLYSFAPPPDLLIYLDLDPQEAFERKKISGAVIDYYECGKDLFSELDVKAGFLAFQSLCRGRYEAVLPKDLTLRLDSSRSHELLSKEILEATLLRLRDQRDRHRASVLAEAIVSNKT